MTENSKKLSSQIFLLNLTTALRYSQSAKNEVLNRLQVGKFNRKFKKLSSQIFLINLTQNLTTALVPPSSKLSLFEFLRLLFLQFHVVAKKIRNCTCVSLSRSFWKSKVIDFERWCTLSSRFPGSRRLYFFQTDGLRSNQEQETNSGNLNSKTDTTGTLLEKNI